MTDRGEAFNPDWVSPPGDTISDLLEEREWSQAELAQRLGYSPKHLNQLVKGKVPLSEDAAMRLERVLGSTAGFWLAREAKYREKLARVEAEKRCADWLDWLDVLPVAELMKADAIPKSRIDSKTKPRIVEQLLQFFGVASPDEWHSKYEAMQGSFRRSRTDQSDVGAITAWLRMGEREAERLDGPRYDEKRFGASLVEIRSLTRYEPEVFGPQLHSICQSSGVALVLVPAIKRTHVSGVARWLNPQRPLIQLSLYGKTNDRFWFAFFHEAAHVLLHGRKAVFLDDPGRNFVQSSEESEANDWAADFLVPKSHAIELRTLDKKDSVKAFAARIGIHPGIVAGRLQHDGIIPINWMNDLKVSFELRGKSTAT